MMIRNHPGKANLLVEYTDVGRVDIIVMKLHMEQNPIEHLQGSRSQLINSRWLSYCDAGSHCMAG